MKQINNGFQTLMVLWLLISLSACNDKKTTEETKNETKTTSKNDIELSATQFKNMGLAFSEISETLISEEIKVTGMTDVPPENVALVSMPINGFIKTLTHNVLEGKFVAKGSVLASIQSMEFVQLQQDYLQALSQGVLLEKELERQRTLVSQDASAQKKVQIAEAEFRNNQVLTRALETKLKILNISSEDLKKNGIQANLMIYAPISGFIKAANVNLGKNITPTDVLFEIISKEHLHLELKVLENDAYKIKEGQKVLFNDVRLGGEVSGRIFLVGKVFGDEAKSLNVHVHLDNEQIESKLIPKMYINARILVEPRKVMALPESCIFREDNQGFVFILKNQTPNQTLFHKIPVKVGVTQNTQTEVVFSEAISPDTKFVSKGVHTLVGMFGSEE
jgi:cobalt-zinc-cadmium efflux system membrane fusion protein